MDIVLFNLSDLRVRDHEPLYYANLTNNEIIHIFIWDCKWDDKTSNEIHIMGNFKKKFLKESLFNLNNNLEKIGIKLNIFYGDPKNIVKNLIDEFKIKSIYTYQNIYDLANVEIKYYWGNTIHNLNDLQFEINNLPKSFYEFKKKINKTVRNELFTNSNGKSIKLKNSINLNNIDIPDVETNIIGGEDEIWKNIINDFYKSKLILNYDTSLNNLLDYNPWLTFGCISYKSLFFQIKTFEKRILKNKNTQLFLNELFLNDYIKFSYLNNNKNLIKNNTSKNKISFSKWINGHTGIPIIDAIMNEIKLTGKTNNICKLITASFLINDLNLDWTLGFEYFNKILIDISFEKNYNIWYYIISNNIYINPIKQIKKYDNDCKYIKKWIPSLKENNNQELHDPKNGINEYYTPIVIINYIPPN